MNQETESGPNRVIGLLIASACLAALLPLILQADRTSLARPVGLELTPTTAPYHAHLPLAMKGYDPSVVYLEKIPSELSLCLGQTGEVDLELQPNAHQVDIAEFFFSFDPDIASVESVQCHSPFSMCQWNDDEANTSGELIVTALSLSGGTRLTPVNIATVTFEGKSPGAFDFALISGETSGIGDAAPVHNSDGLRTSIEVEECGSAQAPTATTSPSLLSLSSLQLY